MLLIMKVSQIGYICLYHAVEIKFISYLCTNRPFLLLDVNSLSGSNFVYVGKLYGIKCRSTAETGFKLEGFVKVSRAIMAGKNSLLNLSDWQNRKMVDQSIVLFHPFDLSIRKGNVTQSFNKRGVVSVERFVWNKFSTWYFQISSNLILPE